MKFDIKEEDMIIKPYKEEGPIYIREQKGFFQRIRRNLGWLLMLSFIPFHGFNITVSKRFYWMWPPKNLLFLALPCSLKTL